MDSVLLVAQDNDGGSNADTALLGGLCPRSGRLAAPALRRPKASTATSPEPFWLS
jgi:hypothetical protein